MSNRKTIILISAVVCFMLAVLLAFTAVIIKLKTTRETQPDQATEAVSETQPPAETPALTDDAETAGATIKKFLKTSMQPVGSTMYVYGGGWNKEDTGAGEYAVTLGIPNEWREFYEQQTADYDNSLHRYEITKGLDCSGYLGWVVYNTLETENGRDGYVFYAQEYADKLAAMGYGEKTDNVNVNDYAPGDIMSSPSDMHVWISLGQCSDGSVVLVNSSPPGVRICGTVTPDGGADSEAVRIAEKFMSERFPEWYSKYSDCLKNISYLTNYDRFRWYTDGRGVLTDPDDYTHLTPEEVLTDIFYG